MIFPSHVAGFSCSWNSCWANDTRINTTHSKCRSDVFVCVRVCVRSAYSLNHRLSVTFIYIVGTVKFHLDGIDCYTASSVNTKYKIFCYRLNCFSWIGWVEAFTSYTKPQSNNPMKTREKTKYSSYLHQYIESDKNT